MAENVAKEHRNSILIYAGGLGWPPNGGVQSEGKRHNLREATGSRGGIGSREKPTI